MIDEQNNNIYFIEEDNNKDETINNMVIENNEKVADDFVNGLPEWDLLPPYEVIRRVSRK